MRHPLVFVGQKVPEKRLIRSMEYKTYLSMKEQASIVEDLKKTVPDLDDYTIAMHVVIELKLYQKDLKPTNDTENT